MKLDEKALFKLSYGLFVLSCNDEKQNGCIINTAMQVTSSPLVIQVAVNNSNYTTEVIKKTGKFNISVLDTTTPFSVFEQFGFKSGRDTDKLANFPFVSYADNGIFYLNKYANAYISAKVIKSIDLGTHTVFFAEVESAHILSENNSLTYQYYFDNIKPKPQVKSNKGFVCKICGYVYEGESLPDDFVCPLCKHPASDFEPIQ